MKNYVEEIIAGRALFTRLNAAEEQGRIRGGRANVEATLLLGRNAGAGRNVEEAEQKLESGRQERILKKWATENGYWIDYSRLSWDLPKVDAGAEALVFMKDGNTLTKVIFYDSGVDDYSATPLEFLDNRISLYNYLSPATAYTLVGFTEFRRNSFSLIWQGSSFGFVVEQPIIKSARETIATQEEIERYMKLKYDAVPVENSADFVSCNYKFFDMHDRNVLKLSDDLFFLIDAQTSLNEIGDEYGGTRVYEDYVICEK